MISPINDLGAIKILCKKDSLNVTGAFYMYILCIFAWSNITVSPYADRCDKEKLAAELA